MDIKLAAQKRVLKEKLGKDAVPAVLYGKGVTNEILKLKRADFAKTFQAAGESNLITLDFGSGPIKVLVKEVQRDVLKGFFTHVDFYQVNMKEKIKTEIPLHFNGEAKAVKELGGVLIKDMSSVEVECLPGDLVDHIDVDISGLNTYSDAIRLHDLKIPAGLTLLLHTNEMVAAVREPRVEEVEPVVEEVPVEGAVAEGAAGAAPAEDGAAAGDDKKVSDKKGTEKKGPEKKEEGKK
jgi:large subunit ribosomal protein L25